MRSRSTPDARRGRYAALNRRANRVARALLARRGRGGDPVALLFEHDAPMIAAILGVLKAGKTYVALDPLDPDERLRCILGDAEACGLVTDADHLVTAARSGRVEARRRSTSTISGTARRTTTSISPSIPTRWPTSSTPRGRPDGRKVCMQTHSERRLLHHDVRRASGARPRRSVDAARRATAPTPRDGHLRGTLDGRDARPVRSAPPRGRHALRAGSRARRSPSTTRRRRSSGISCGAWPRRTSFPRCGAS